jgi:hypothetical protein
MKKAEGTLKDVTLEGCQDARRSIQEELLETVDELFVLSKHFENCDPNMAEGDERNYLLTFAESVSQKAYEAVRNALSHTYGVI